VNVENFALEVIVTARDLVPAEAEQAR